MDNGTAQWIIATVVTLVVIPLAGALWREREKRFDAERQLAIYEHDVPKAIRELNLAADRQRQLTRPQPYSSLHGRRSRPFPPAPRSRRR